MYEFAGHSQGTPTTGPKGDGDLNHAARFFSRTSPLVCVRRPRPDPDLRLGIRPGWLVVLVVRMTCAGWLWLAVAGCCWLLLAVAGCCSLWLATHREPT